MPRDGAAVECVLRLPKPTSVVSSCWRRSCEIDAISFSIRGSSGSRMPPGSRRERAASARRSSRAWQSQARDGETPDEVRGSCAIQKRRLYQVFQSTLPPRIYCAWHATSPHRVARVPAAAPVPRAQAPSASATPQQMSGRVVDARTGEPRRRARVTLTIAGRAGNPVFTGDEGRFVIADAPRPPFTVTVSKAGYMSVSGVIRRPRHNWRARSRSRSREAWR